MQRFSNKELLKSVKTEFIVPEGYKELHNAQLLHETEKAMYIEFVYLARTWQIWYPKTHVIVHNNKYYGADWVTNKNIV